MSAPPEVPDQTQQEKQKLFKVLVIGDYAVGKTSLIKRYTEGYFTPNYKLTIGVDFAVKNVAREDGSQITLQLWDIAGHERFGSMTRVYYKYAIAAVIVYDLQRPATFDAVLKWKEDVDSKVELPNGEHIPCILLANKCDLSTGATLDTAVLDKFAQDHGFIGWFTTSALSDTNIDKAMLFLTNKIIEVASHCNPPEKPADTLSLSNNQNQNQQQQSPETPKESHGCCGN